MENPDVWRAMSRGCEAVETHPREALQSNRGISFCLWSIPRGLLSCGK